MAGTLFHRCRWDAAARAHVGGAEATELIAELGLAITLEATFEEIEATIHAHPTLSEAVHEATGAAYGLAIHF
jgi:dihydrolipoamide dehydrogenase